MNLFTTIHLYPERIAMYDNFSHIEIDGIEFLDKSNPDLDNVVSCEINPDFYSVFIVIPGNGRECVADCKDIETAQKIKELILHSGKYYYRDEQ